MTLPKNKTLRLTARGLIFVLRTILSLPNTRILGTFCAISPWSRGVRPKGRVDKRICPKQDKSHCRHGQRRCSFLGDVAFTPPFFFSRLGGWQNCIYTFNFERERDYPYRNGAAASTPPGGWFWENLILIFQCWFSRRISLPTRNHGGRRRKRRTRRRSYSRAGGGSIFLITNYKRGFQ